MPTSYLQVSECDGLYYNKVPALPVLMVYGVVFALFEYNATPSHSKESTSRTSLFTDG